MALYTATHLARDAALSLNTSPATTMLAADAAAPTLTSDHPSRLLPIPSTLKRLIHYSHPSTGLGTAAAASLATRSKTRATVHSILALAYHPIARVTTMSVATVPALATISRPIRDMKCLAGTMPHYGQFAVKNNPNRVVKFNNGGGAMMASSSVALREGGSAHLEASKQM